MVENRFCVGLLCSRKHYHLEPLLQLQQALPQVRSDIKEELQRWANLLINFNCYIVGVFRSLATLHQGLFKSEDEGLFAGIGLEEFARRDVVLDVFLGDVGGEMRIFA